MVIRAALALLLVLGAMACAGATGMFFEESRIQLGEGNTKNAARLTAKSVGMALCAFSLGIIAVMLVQR